MGRRGWSQGFAAGKRRGFVPRGVYPEDKKEERGLHREMQQRKKKQRCEKLTTAVFKTETA